MIDDDVEYYVLCSVKLYVHENEMKDNERE